MTQVRGTELHRRIAIYCLGIIFLTAKFLSGQRELGYYPRGPGNARGIGDGNWLSHVTSGR